MVFPRITKGPSMSRPLVFSSFLLAVLAPAAVASDDASKRTPKEALQAFNDLIGSWHGSGEPSGTREDRQKGFWQEGISWQWQFKGDDAWLSATFDKGKYFTSAELRYLPDADRYQLTLRTPAKEELVFKGPLEEHRLTLERTDDKTGEAQRLVISLLHSNRYLYRYDVKPADHTVFTPVYQVGVTKDGASFAVVDDGPECVVSGGHGTMSTTYKGKTYYFCCTGCRDAFNDNPEKYIKEYETRKAKEKEAGK
jgi:YHS domain-containing protein